MSKAPKHNTFIACFIGAVTRAGAEIRKCDVPELRPEVARPKPKASLAPIALGRHTHGIV